MAARYQVNSESGNAGFLVLIVIFILGILSEGVTVETGPTPEQVQATEAHARAQADYEAAQEKESDRIAAEVADMMEAARRAEQERQIRHVGDVLSSRYDPPADEKRSCDLLHADAVNQRAMEQLNSLPQFSVMTPYARQRLLWKIKNRLAQLGGGCYW